MDGLLVDTEHVWFEVESELVTELGGSWDRLTRRRSSATPRAHLDYTPPPSPARCRRPSCASGCWPAWWAG